MSAQTINR